MCISPIIIKRPAAFGHRYVYQPVPCGKCIECVTRVQNDWKVRMIQEFNFFKRGVFFTLTYDDSKCFSEIVTDVDFKTGEIRYNPYRGRKVTKIGRDGRPRVFEIDGITRTCRPVHIQNWLKRFRTSSGYSRNDFSYFITSENGPTTFRPHYHGIIFGLDSKALSGLFSDWTDRYGFVDYSDIKNTCDGHLSQGSVANYCSKYCCKGEFESPLVDYGQLPSFRLMSKNIGFSYIEERRSYHLALDSLFSKLSSDRSSFHDVDSLYLFNSFGCNFTDDYVSEVVSRHCILYDDSSSGRVYRYAFPRYFHKKLFQDVSFSFNGEEKDFSFLLSHQVADLLSQHVLSQFERSVERVQDSFSSRLSYVDKVRLYDRSRSASYQKKRLALANFYNSSFF